MKNSIGIALCAICFCCAIQEGYAQDPNATIWGVFASGVGEPLKPGMDPCQVTYTVAMMTDLNIVANIGYGTMSAVGSNLTWFEASAMRRLYGRYFEDKPDGTFKTTPCDVPPISLNGTFSTGYGPIVFRHSGGNISGTYYEGDGKVSGRLNGLVFSGTWSQTKSKTSGDFVFTFSSDGSSFDGKWRNKGASTWNQNWDGARVKD